MERRRRQRINNCLEELKSMLEALSKKNEVRDNERENRERARIRLRLSSR
jgi:hypothetical protein